MNITVIDYGAGNIRSVVNAFEAIGCKVTIAKKPSELAKAERIVLPGVGAFEAGIKNLTRLGFKEPLEKLVLNKKKPFLGICLGMQLLAKKSFELGEHEGLGWIKGSVEKLKPRNLKVPHVGWNDVGITKKNILFKGIKEPVFYFVHSYCLKCKNQRDVIATCDYGQKFTAAVQHENIFAVQFHPEKSQQNGLQLLKNFTNFKG